MEAQRPKVASAPRFAKSLADLSAPLRREAGFTYNVAGLERIRFCTMPSPIVQKLQEEIQALERELNYDLPKELKRARALGDLSENAEYSMAKQRQDYVSARLMQLKNRLADLSLINMNNIPGDRIAFGSKVTLYDLDRDVEIEYRWVISEEADVSSGGSPPPPPLAVA